MLNKVLNKTIFLAFLLFKQKFYNIHFQNHLQKINTKYFNRQLSAITGKIIALNCLLILIIITANILTNTH